MTRPQNTLEATVQDLEDKAATEKARAYIWNEYPFIKDGDLHLYGLLTAILTEVVKARFLSNKGATDGED